MNRSPIPVGALLGLLLPVFSLSQEPSAVGSETRSPATFGTAHVSYLEMPAVSFLPWDSSQTYTTSGFGRGPRWVTGGGSLNLVAPLHLPSGARITYVELDYVDTNSSRATLGQLVICDYKGMNCTFHPSAGVGTGDCLVAGFICSGVADTTTASGGSKNADLTAENLVVDNFLNSYSLVAYGDATDGSEQVGGMIVGYVLQVSPPPVVATFSDVPTSSPQFKFVEALYAAGITGGCAAAPLRYCPNDPITRGQMAVFLATALGLQWP